MLLEFVMSEIFSHTLLVTVANIRTKFKEIFHLDEMHNKNRKKKKFKGTVGKFVHR